MVRTPNPEGGTPTIHNSTLNMGDSRGRARDPRRCMCMYTCVNKRARAHTHFRHRDASVVWKALITNKSSGN